MTMSESTPEGRTSAFLVQQDAPPMSWSSQNLSKQSLESMPLACGYIKATALADVRIRESMEIAIHNFLGGTTNAKIANTLFSASPPDILAFSVCAWNYPSAGATAATYKQINPGGWVVFGGAHVDRQAERAFRMFPDVDVVVNGEGELTFRDLLTAYLDGTPKDRLHHIPGISFREGDGTLITTAPRERMTDLEIIPSPFLTGALELTDADGVFKYDYALMETNRGCPYKCSFCYWGTGAVGQKVRSFSMDRLRQELELFGRHKVHTIFLCDANFGMLPADVDFVQAAIETREKYGFPRVIEACWAKNKSKNFYRIVKMMKEAGFRTTFTLSLQTLNDSALETMKRRNMKVNDWEELVAWLHEEQLAVFGELIWGAPGETVESFLEGYDRLASRVSHIAIYPLVLLPNTDFAEKKDLFGIKTFRSDIDDFEYLLSHNTVTLQENRLMQRFVLWARAFGELGVFRHIWAPLRVLAGMTQSQVIRNFESWIDETDDPTAAPLRSFADVAMDGVALAAFGQACEYLYGEPDAKRLLQCWWSESIRPQLATDVAPVLDEVFRYDLLTQPVYERPNSHTPQPDLPVVTVLGADYYVRRGVHLAYDVPWIESELRADRIPNMRPSPRVVDLYYLLGSETAIHQAENIQIMEFTGRTHDQMSRPVLDEEVSCL
ncbi:KedN5 family methylcobalamin-dependent radical SAM C-methyltransferase [Streptomyces sp. NPDC005125]